MKLITKLILILGSVCLSPRRENIALSNLCCNKVKREVRNQYSYKSNCYVEVK